MNITRYDLPNDLFSFSFFFFRRSTPFGWFLANALLFKKVKAALGLDRAKLLCTAAAPLSPKTNDFFLSLDLVLYEIYGMTECTGTVRGLIHDSGLIHVFYPKLQTVE